MPSQEEQDQISAENEHFFARFREVGSENRDLPDSYDSRTNGHVTEVKNQRQCGSCVAFATTSAIETCMILAGASKSGMDLSEQSLIDCGYNGR